MLVSTISLGLQRILMEMSDGVALQGLLTAALLCMAFSIGCRPLARVDTR